MVAIQMTNLYFILDPYTGMRIGDDRGSSRTRIPHCARRSSNGRLAECTVHSRNHISSNLFRLLTKCLLMIEVLLLCHSINASTKVIVNSYTTVNGTINFTHVAYDPQADRLYVGASNWLYQFNATLFMESAVKTGPVDDSPLCSPKDCEGVETLPTTNVNKVLVIDKQSQKLIVCGSVHQGACQRHALDDIARREELIPLPIAANDENSSTSAFIGSARYFGQTTPVLYVATTNSRLGPYRDMIPAISSRSLESGPRLFSIIEKDFSDNARLDFNFHLRDYYLVSYVYGFHVNDFAYFATVQKRSHLRVLEEWGYITRLARVCSSDVAYNTYTEVTLQCLSADGTDYTLLQDATIIRASSDISRDFGITYGDKVLVGVFSTAKDHTSRPADKSAVCVYSIEEIEEKFLENIHLCLNGSVFTRNMDYIAGNIQNCPQPGKSANFTNICTETLKLNGSIPISRRAAITYANETLTAVTAVIVGQHNVLFLGTANGHLKKLLLSKVRVASEFEDVEVHFGNTILPDIFVDRSQQYVYAASPYKLSKVSIEHCQHYTSYRECLQARNPYCGWCSFEKRCTPVKAVCNSTSILVTNRAKSQEKEKVQHKNVQLTDMNPKLGPQSGGTRISLTGLNLNVGSNVEIFLDNYPCEVKKTTISSKQITCRTPSSPFAPYKVEKVRLIIDGTNLTLHKTFTFTEDPRIVDIFPKRSYKSGGRVVTVFGTNLSSIQQPKISVFNANSLVNETVCSVVNDTMMLCPSPSVEEAVRNISQNYGSRSEEFELKLRVGFEMDNVQSVKELERYFPELDAHLIYVPDPKFFYFKNNGIKLYKGESLVIEGENLRLALNEAEVNVTIGTQFCNITSISMTQLVCLPPEIHSPEDKHDLQAVFITVGENLKYNVGYLKYDMEVAYEVPLLLIGVIIALGPLLMILSLILLAVIRHKSTQAERDYNSTIAGLHHPLQRRTSIIRHKNSQVDREYNSTLARLHQPLARRTTVYPDKSTQSEREYISTIVRLHNPLQRGTYSDFNSEHQRYISY